MISLTSQRLQESDRASFFSLLTTGSALGTLLTGSLGSYLLDNYNWSKVFQVLGNLRTPGYLNQLLELRLCTQVIRKLIRIVFSITY